jgi:hypothetical protein
VDIYLLTDEAKILGSFERFNFFGHKAYNTLSRTRKAIKVGRSITEYSQSRGFGSRTMST